MKIHHLRSATFIIESGKNFILIDPMLSGKEALPAFSLFRFKAKRNPLVDLPLNAEKLLSQVTHCLITHSQTFNIRAFQHTDHLDKVGENFLIKNNIPVITVAKDVEYLKSMDLMFRLELAIGMNLSFLEDA